MTFFDKIYHRLFSTRPDKLGSKEPMVSEPLKRSTQEQTAYFRWVNEGHYHELLQRIRRAYQLKRVGQLDQLQLHLFRSPYANGIAITYNPEIFKGSSCINLFDLLKDKMLNLGYKLSVSDRRLFDRGNYVETIEKYYLKPRHDNQTADTKLFDQRYGNVLIEHVIIDQQSSYLKLLANIYSDRLYTKALDFEELLDQLLA